MLEARRHELRGAHGAGIGPEGGLGIKFARAREQQELLEFPAEVLAARRVVEAQRHERIEHAVTALQAAEVGLDAGDAQQVFGLHLPLHGNGVEQFAMLAPQPGAGIDALVIQEARAVFPPGQRFLGGPVHRLDDLRLRLGLAEDRVDLRARHARGRQLLDEGCDLGAFEIEPGMSGQCALRRRRPGRIARAGGRQRRGAVQGAKQREGQERGVRHHELTSFRCEYNPMRIPKPASSVTTELPP